MGKQDQVELILRFEFCADHALVEYEEQHTHLWKVTCGIKGTPLSGRLIDMIKVRETFERPIVDLRNTFLNQNSVLRSTSAWDNPTCETLSEYFISRWKQSLEEFKALNASLELSFVEVAICETSGIETGAVRITLGRTKY